MEEKIYEIKGRGAMNDHTKRILGRVLQALEKLEDGEYSLQYIVSFLEGSMNVIEEKLPKSFLDIWDSSLGDLDLIDALSLAESKNANDSLPDVSILKSAVMELDE